MSLNLSFGGHPHPDEPRWIEELTRLLAAHEQPPHEEPSGVELAVWGVKRRVLPLVSAAGAVADTFSLLGWFSLSDSVFVPGERGPRLEVLGGPTIGSLETLVAELETLDRAWREDELDTEGAPYEAVCVFLQAARAAQASGCALWLR